MYARHLRSTLTLRCVPVGVLSVVILGMPLAWNPLPAQAASISQLPSEFEIDVDGFFTGPDEWSDVQPAVRLGGGMFVYTSTDPGQEALYLMYDFVDSVAPVGPGDTAGPVHFHNGGALFEVFFLGSGDISVLKDGEPLDLSDPAGGEDSMGGAVGFGASPNSATPHNMFELEVLFTAEMPAGHSHGQYSPDPSHWGADLPTDPAPEPEQCTIQPEEIQCFPTEIPPGEPIPVPCPEPQSDCCLLFLGSLVMTHPH